MQYKLTPWTHQLKVIDKVKKDNLNFFALFHDMGAGKTKTVIEILRDKCAEEEYLLKTLIICPLAVMTNWEREILAHSYITENSIQLIDGCTKPNGKKVKNPQKKIREEQLKNETAKIFILNTDNVSNQYIWDAILQMGIEFLIVDESHRFKAPNGKRTKNLHKLSLNCRYKFILTGSPILQNALDLWSQFYILSPYILGNNYFSFRATYFYDRNAGMPSHVHFPDFQPRKDMNKNLSDIIYQYADRVMKDDVLDLPPRTYQTMEVTMSKEQRRIYEEMRDYLVAFLEEEDISAIKLPKDMKIDDMLPDDMMKTDLAIVKTLRLQQIICGIFTTDEGEVKHLSSDRLKILDGILDELLVNKENKIIIWTVFTPTYSLIEELCKAHNIDYVFLTGKQNKKEKQDNIDAFNNDPDCRVIIANQSAGGTGVNLTAANYEIYYSRSFKLEDDLQSDARAYRGGQKRKTTRIDLVTPDTIDARIVEALAEKRKHAEDILNPGSEFTPSEILGMI